MTKKIKIFLSAMFLVSLMVACLPVKDTAYAATEDEVSYTAMQKLQQIAKAQSCYYTEMGLESYYPPISLCGNPDSRFACFNGSSLLDSTADLQNAIGHCAGALDLSVSGTRGGDVRFRCRNQQNRLFCFAYRCKEAAPAGCEQMWRIESRYHSDNATTYKCIDIGENDAICSSRPPSGFGQTCTPHCGM